MCVCVLGIQRKNFKKRKSEIQKKKEEKRSKGLKVGDSGTETQRPLSLLSPPHKVSHTLTP